MWDFGESKLKIADPVESSLPPPVAHECEKQEPLQHLVAWRTEAGAMVVEQKGRKKQKPFYGCISLGARTFLFIYFKLRYS